MSKQYYDCGARQHSDQMLCSTCGLAWDVNDPEPPMCPATAQPARESGRAPWPWPPSATRLAATAQPARESGRAPSVEQELGRAARSSSLTSDAAHAHIASLTALLRSSPVASAKKIPTEAPNPAVTYHELRINGESVRVSSDDVRKACEPVGRVVVCAALAISTTDGLLTAIGPRHFDRSMMQQLAHRKGTWDEAPSEGFIDQWGVFMPREEALIVAYHAGQLGRRKKCHPYSQLFSEDLY